MSKAWNEQVEKLLLFSLIADPDNVPRATFDEFAATIGSGISGNAAR